MGSDLEIFILQGNAADLVAGPLDRIPRFVRSVIHCHPDRDNVFKIALVMVTGFHIGNPAELQRGGRIIPDLPLDPVFERDRAVPGPGCLDIHDLPLIKETIPDHFMGRPVPGLRFQEDLLSRTDNTVAVHTVEDHKIIPLLALRHGIIVGLFGFAFLHSGSCCRCSLRPLRRLFLFLQNDFHGFVPAFFRIHGNSRK